MTITRLEIQNLIEVHRSNLISLGKRPRANWQPTLSWCEDQLHAQHSTLENCHIVVEAVVSGTTASHVVRHTKGHPRFVVESHRPDWTGKTRPPASTDRLLYIKASPYAFIEMFRQRLCHLASTETRQFFTLVAAEMYRSEDVMLHALGLYAMPDCLYRGGTCHMNEKAWAGCKMVPHWRSQ